MDKETIAANVRALDWEVYTNKDEGHKRIFSWQVVGHARPIIVSSFTHSGYYTITLYSSHMVPKHQMNRRIRFGRLEDILEAEDLLRNKIKFKDGKKFFDHTYEQLHSLYRIRKWNEVRVGAIHILGEKNDE